MSRYIDSDKISAKLMDEYHGMISDESMKIYKIMQMLDNAPTADVQEVKHAKWEMVGNYKVECTNCHHVRDIKTQCGWNFCPICGAKIGLED